MKAPLTWEWKIKRTKEFEVSKNYGARLQVMVTDSSHSSIQAPLQKDFAVAPIQRRSPFSHSLTLA